MSEGEIGLRPARCFDEAAKLRIAQNLGIGLCRLLFGELRDAVETPSLVRKAGKVEDIDVRILSHLPDRQRLRARIQDRLEISGNELLRPSVTGRHQGDSRDKRSGSSGNWRTGRVGHVWSPFVFNVCSSLGGKRWRVQYCCEVLPVFQSLGHQSRCSAAGIPTGRPFENRNGCYLATPGFFE